MHKVWSQSPNVSSSYYDTYSAFPSGQQGWVSWFEDFSPEVGSHFLPQDGFILTLLVPKRDEVIFQTKHNRGKMLTGDV